MKIAMHGMIMECLHYFIPFHSIRGVSNCVLCFSRETRRGAAGWLHLADSHGEVLRSPWHPDGVAGTGAGSRVRVCG